ncbi:MULTISPECIES: ACT domain-containing protein [unclassified Candidatus Frackibacter]|uniref:ACT domain-containing protein n=1 Tax=unclassified Candidatus Frackibacter TaxID=2648818 RepID=UPI000891C5B8|nr:MULTISPECIES: ACT domain-containing protein [unclassified Candidatus Frackibacter]SDC23819.1 ACT domain-containing protein [Candidatus Frackibacter sp. WG11]SEM48161.1 ACT domain-containing protein [Candidatus Frackibacter sp. WG12]SFL50123.1 ACT domain-containing protein [Candidatus Frackibacter sp. WG13]
MQEEKNNRIVVTVLGEDKVGIVANITTVLAEHKANIIDISQSLLQDLFSMIMLVDISEIDISFEELQNELQDAGQELDLKVMTQHEDIFRYMHRV